MDSKPKKTTRRKGAASASASASASAAAQLTDDLVVEILSRLPAKSWCRFKCVSKSWLAFASDPYYRAKLPQPTAGLFFHPAAPGSAEGRHCCNTAFAALTPDAAAACGVDTTLSFLPRFHCFEIVDSCHGLLLCRFKNCESSVFHYLVCNPTTKNWAVLPDPVSEPDGCCYDLALGHDPAAAPGCFHVFCFQRMEPEEDLFLSETDMSAVVDLSIFSTETGRWVDSQIFWQEDVAMGCPPYVFLNGMLHVLATNGVIFVVDAKGLTGRVLNLPKETDDFEGCLGQAAGCLTYMVPEQDGRVISVWRLRDYEEWVLEESLSMKDAHGADIFVYCTVKEVSFCKYSIVGFDLARDVIFLRDKEEDKFLAYSTTTGELKEIGTGVLKYVPYVPCYVDPCDF